MVGEQMYSNKVVVVAGGSRGLGLEIANEFARRGATIVLLARDIERLKNAAKTVAKFSNHQPHIFAVDLTNFDATSKAVSDIVGQTGRIDVWANAVGQSIRTAFSDCTPDQYRQLMEQNFFASVNGTLASLDAVALTSGSLVNIGSLASRTAWPFLAPYVTSKHALAGFAKQIRLEGPENVHYLFVCPGPIKSDPNANRYSDQTDGLPESANKPGAGAPVKAIDPIWLAGKIVDSCAKRRREIVVPFKSRLLFILAELMPNFADSLVRRFSSK